MQALISRRRIAIAAPILGVLLIAAIFGVTMWRQASEDPLGRWMLPWQDRPVVWTPEPWALTAADFAGHRTAEIPIDDSWLEFTGSFQDPGPDVLYPPGMPAFKWLMREDSFTRGMFRLIPEDDDTVAISGVEVDGVQVFSVVLAVGEASFETDYAHNVRYLQSNAEDVLTWWEPGDDGFVKGTFLGDSMPYERLGRLLSRNTPYQLGEAGYFGTRVIETDAGGREQESTAVATVVDGAFVAVGRVVPPGASAPDELSVTRLLDRLVAEVREPPA